MTTLFAPAAVLLPDRLNHWSVNRPDAPAMTFGAQTFTWSQWRDRVLLLTGALRSAGVTSGDRVAVLDQNHLATLELTLAASALGAATVVANYRLPSDQIRFVLEDSRPAMLFTGAAFTQLALDAGADTLVRNRVVVGGDSDEYEAFLSTGTRDEGSPISADDVCLVLYTSGTTGRAKGTELTHRGLIAHSEAANVVFTLGPDDVNLVAMPLFHVGGTCYALLGIHGGAQTILLREPTPAALFGAIGAGATHAFVVPTVVHNVLAAGEQAIKAFGRLRSLGYGAAPMPRPMLLRALAAWPDLKFIQAYGMTELAGVVTMLDAEAHRDLAHPEWLGSVGAPLDGVEMRVVDPDLLLDVEPGATGELWFRTAQAMRGYLNRPDATAAMKTEDGWIRTGDIGRRDEAGFVYVLDRLKDVIITGAENVYGPEVESVLGACPGVAEAVVIGVPDERWGETVRAVVVPSPGAEFSAHAAIAFCRERLAHYQCPTSVDIVSELPRNGAGKVLKHVLRQSATADRSQVS